MTARRAFAPVREELLLEEPERVALYPIRDEEVWQWYKKLEGLDWTAQEVDMSRDRRDWKRMPAGQRRYYEHILGFFAIADELILDNLDENFMREVKQKEASYFYRAQTKQECVHSEAYSIQVETLMSDKRKDEIFRAIETMPVVAKMAAWIRRWMDRGLTFGERLVAFAVIEGVFFSGHFLAIQLLKEQGLMPGVTSYNEFIARDEGMHCLFACFLLRHRIRREPEEGTAHMIVKEAVLLVDEFMAAATQAAREADIAAGYKKTRLDGVVPNITAELMRQYIRYVADTLCGHMHFSPIYHATNPYPELDKLSLNEVGKSNFFEYRPTQYQNFTTAGALTLAVDSLREEELKY
jgi:ribonucleotide reductase beta subunit family protein with ferritin-like domain